MSPAVALRLFHYTWTRLMQGKSNGRKGRP